MKKFKIILLVAVMLMGWNAAYAMTAAERIAQAEVSNYLTRQGFKVEIDREDESVMFKQSDILYWITFSGDGDGVLYTLHRRPIKLKGDKDDADKVNRKNEKAVYAVNMLNRSQPYKAMVKHARVDFVFPVYASTPAEYIKQLPNVLGSMRDIKAQFDKCYDRSQIVVDSVHDYWANENPELCVLPQGEAGVVHKLNADFRILKSAVASYDLPNIKEDTKPRVEYDAPLYTSNCHFLREKVTIRADKPGQYMVGVKIYNPAGKLIVPNIHSTFTTITKIDVKKANKEMEFELRPFGTAKSDFWTPGVYRIEYYDGDALVRKEVFNIE